MIGHLPQGVQGPSEPAIIAHRYACPSCGARYGEPCRTGRFPQEYSHVGRHKIADADDWRRMRDEIAAGEGHISSISYARS